MTRNGHIWQILLTTKRLKTSSNLNDGLPLSNLDVASMPMPFKEFGPQRLPVCLNNVEMSLSELENEVAAIPLPSGQASSGAENNEVFQERKTSVMSSCTGKNHLTPAPTAGTMFGLKGMLCIDKQRALQEHLAQNADWQRHRHSTTIKTTSILNEQPQRHLKHHPH